MDKMKKNQHDPAKTQEVFDLWLNKFCDRAHLPLFVLLADYPAPSRRHRHCDFSELLVAIDGTAVSCVPDREVPVKAGASFVLTRIQARSSSTRSVRCRV